MADKIFLQGLTVPCIIGTLPRERKKKQRIVIDMEFPAPVQKAAKRDDLRDALNYQKIAEYTAGFVSKSHFYLIETLAERLACKLILKFKIKSIVLCVSKPGAIPNTRNVGVLIERKEKKC